MGMDGRWNGLPMTMDIYQRMEIVILNHVSLSSLLFEHTLWVMCRVQTQSEVPGMPTKRPTRSLGHFLRAANSFLVLRKQTRDFDLL